MQVEKPGQRERLQENAQTGLRRMDSYTKQNNLVVADWKASQNAQQQHICSYHCQLRREYWSYSEHRLS